MTNRHIIVGVLILVAFGIWARLYGISDNQFIFYDEGMYLGYNRAFLNLVAQNPPHDFSEFLVILSLMFKTALTTAKALWFFILNLRVFFFGPEAWFFSRCVSAVAGLATVALTYFWAKRYCQSQRTALLSGLFLLILPSHVFYSRLGMQEALSTLIFMAAVYFFTLRPGFQWRVIVSAILLSAVFLTNYRMIIAPIFMVLIDGWESLRLKQRIDWRRLGFYVLCFYGIVFVTGSLYGGVNREVTFGWMFHQAQDVPGKFDFLSLLSYPFYVFVLEGLFFGIIFWSNLYLLFQRQWVNLLPFGIVILQMFLFSFAPEKGARYLCVVLPFMAVAAAVSVNYFLSKPYQRAIQRLCSCILIVAVGGMLLESSLLAMARTGYEDAVRFVMSQDERAVIVSTQPLVEALYVRNEHQVVACPKDLAGLLTLFHQGARYLIVDPQAYISWTSNGQRFSPPLNNFLERIVQNQPNAHFAHLNQSMLTRFVLDHNEHLINSLAFLSDRNQLYGRIKVYDLTSFTFSLFPQ